MPQPMLRRRKNSTNAQSTSKNTALPAKPIVFSKLHNKTKDDNEKQKSEKIQTIKTTPEFSYQFIDGVFPGSKDPCQVVNMTWPFLPYCQSFYLEFYQSDNPVPPGPGSTILMGYSALTHMDQEDEYAEMVWDCINNNATKKMFETYIANNYIYSIYQMVGSSMNCYGEGMFNIDATSTPPQITPWGFNDDITYSISLSYVGETICPDSIELDDALTYPYDTCIQNIQFPTPPAPPLIPEIARDALLASSICCGGLLFAFAYKCCTWKKQGSRPFPSPRMMR